MSGQFFLPHVFEGDNTMNMRVTSDNFSDATRVSFFDFHSYHAPPLGLKVLEASRECLRLYRHRDHRQYIITCPEPSCFDLHYTSEVSREPQFIARAGTFYRVLQMLGALHGGQS